MGEQKPAADIYHEGYKDANGHPITLERLCRTEPEWAKAKGAGFQWNPDGKVWTRRMAIEDAEALPFPVRRI